MRVLLAVVVLTMVCAPMALANGAKVTPPTEPEVIAPPPVAPPPPPETGAGPSVAPVSGPITMVPMMVPVLMSKSVAAKLPCGSNVLVLVPTTVDANMAARIQSNRQIIFSTLPVSVPVVASTQIVGRAISGAGPCPVNIDQAPLNRIMSGQNVVLMPMVSPTPLTESMFGSVCGGQPVMIDQATLTRMSSPSQPLMLMPLSLSTPVTTAMSGRGPSACAYMSSNQVCGVLSSGTVLVGMLMDRQSMANMASNSSLAMVVPMMMPVPVTCTSPSTPTTPTAPQY